MTVITFYGSTSHTDVVTDVIFIKILKYIVLYFIN